MVGNCQTTALASVIYRSSGIKVTMTVDINAEGTEAYQHAHRALCNTDSVDFCFSQQLGDNFGEISSKNLREKYGARYKQFTNLYFTGFHPDLTYFGARNFRVQSALGDYHSRIALIGYLKSLSVSKTVELFRLSSYESLGYFANFEHSKSELIRRDEENDVKFAEEFFAIAQSHVPLYTVNHPTAHALAPLAEMIIESTGHPRPRIDAVAVKNPLVDGSIWPIYPEISSALNMSYPGDMTFYPSFSDQAPPMNLEEFVSLSFARYEEIGLQRILEIPGADNLRQQNI